MSKITNFLFIRLKQHLQKCKLHYSHLNLIECEYNMMHVIAKNEKAVS